MALSPEMKRFYRARAELQAAASDYGQGGREREIANRRLQHAAVKFFIARMGVIEMVLIEEGEMKK